MNATNELISINQAAARGIKHLRQPNWAIAEDHLKIDINDGRPGLWLHLYSPFNLECNGRDPVSIIWLQMDLTQAAWLPYTGPIAGSDEYQAAQTRYKGCLSDEVSATNNSK